LGQEKNSQVKSFALNLGEGNQLRRGSEGKEVDDFTFLGKCYGVTIEPSLMDARRKGKMKHSSSSQPTRTEDPGRLFPSIRGKKV